MSLPHIPSFVQRHKSPTSDTEDLQKWQCYTGTFANRVTKFVTKIPYYGMQLVNKCSFVILELITRTAVNFALKKTKQNKTPNQKQTNPEIPNSTAPLGHLSTSYSGGNFPWETVSNLGLDLEDLPSQPESRASGRKPSCSLSSPGQRDGKGHACLG